MSEHTLKPCPFCGEQPTINHIEAHSHSFQINGFKMPDHPGSCVIECTCGAGLIDSDFDTVAARWNARAMLLPEVPLAIGNSFNERVLNVLGETWNLVSFPLEQPFKAQARTEIMRLMNEIVSMRNEPDAEALRKESEQLRAALGSLSKRCYIMSESHQVNDVRGARLIVGFNNIVDAGDAHSAISALKGGAA